MITGKSNFDEQKWATGQSCIRKEVTSYTFHTLVCEHWVLNEPSWHQMVGICDLPDTTYAPVSKIPSVKKGPARFQKFFLFWDRISS